METPSEWAKRFNQKDAEGGVEVSKPQPATVSSSASGEEFPNEPFLCPACGQLLGPACRVCVACKHPINPAEIGRTTIPAVHAEAPAAMQVPPEAVRYPWWILVTVIAIGMIIGLIAVTVLGDQKGSRVIQALPIIVGFWVFYDAFKLRIPRPFRWGMGTMLLLALVFPWYLARRKKPQAAVPFIEAETRPVTRVLLILLLVVFLMSVVINIWQGQQSTSTPGSAPKSGSGSRITLLRPGAKTNPLS